MSKRQSKTEVQSKGVSQSSPALNFKISGKGRSDDGTMFVVVECAPIDDRPRQVAIPEVSLRGSLQAIDVCIHDATGIRLPKGELPSIDAEIRAASLLKPSFTVCDRPGWVPGQAVFVVPGQIILTDKVEIVQTRSLTDPLRVRKFVRRGDLARWQQKVGVLLAGNSRLTLALVQMLSGPVIPLMNEEHFAIAFVGAGGTGKTKIAAVASMVWGADPDPVEATKLGLGLSMKSTLNSLDAVFASFNHMGLFLDEMNAIPGHPRERGAAIKQLIFAFTDGHTKARMTDAIRERWVVPLLVTANSTLSSEGVVWGGGEEAAYLDRYIEIGLPQGTVNMIENLHGFECLDEFLATLTSSAIENAGTPGRAFVQILVHWMKDEPVWTRSWLLDFRKDFMGRSAHTGGPPRLRRRFAVLYAAGMAAIEAKVLPLREKELFVALNECLVDHLTLTRRNHQSQADVHDVVQSIWIYYRKEAKAMPVIVKHKLLVEDVHDHVGCPGYRAISRSGGRELLLTEKAFREIISGLVSESAAKALLKKEGLLTSQREGQQQRFSVKRVIGQTANGDPWKVSVLAFDFDRLKAVATEPAVSAS